MDHSTEKKKNARTYVEDIDDIDFPTPALKKRTKEMSEEGTETSSTSAVSDDERLQRMSDALRTIIEVTSFVVIF